MAYINISSILSIKPLTTWSYHCGVKAARCIASSLHLSFVYLHYLPPLQGLCVPCAGSGPAAGHSAELQSWAARHHYDRRASGRLPYAPGWARLYKTISDNKYTSEASFILVMGAKLATFVKLSSETIFAVVRTIFEDLKRSGALLKPAKSAIKLIDLLRRRTFKSGGNKDYYDDMNMEGWSGEGTLAVSRPYLSER